MPDVHSACHKGRERAASAEAGSSTDPSAADPYTEEMSDIDTSDEAAAAHLAQPLHRYGQQLCLDDNFVRQITEDIMRDMADSIDMNHCAIALQRMMAEACSL